jgi:PPIC-type PPIASE domain
MDRRFRFVLRTALTVLMIPTLQQAWSQQPPAASASIQITRAQDVVITVDDQKMTAADVDKFIESLPPQYRAYYRGPGRPLLPQYLVQMKVLLEEARKENLQDLPEVKAAIEIASNSILADAARKRLEEKIPVSDQEIEALYEKRKTDLEEVRLRRIVLVTDTASIQLPERPTHAPVPEAEARKKLEDLRKQALAGADFALLAKAYSDDEATAHAGGDIGYAKRSGLLPPVAKVAFGLAPGQVSDIIGTPYGLELIKVEDRRTPPLAEVRKELEAEVRKAKAGQSFQQAMSQHKVVVDKEFFAAKPIANTAATLVSH